MTEFPGNSHKERSKAPRVARGPVVRRKASFTQRVLGVVSSGDSSTIVGFLITDVVIPGVKRLLSDATAETGGFLTRAVERRLYGDSRPPQTGYTQYSRGPVGYSSGPSHPRNQAPWMNAPQPPQAPARRHDFDNLIFHTRVEAEEALGVLVDLTDSYGSATVADLYDTAGITTNYVDNRWGWHDLRTARVMPTRGGYRIELPPARELQ